MLIQLIIIQLLTFAAIVFVLKRLLYTETNREIRRLTKLKEENLEKQTELEQKISAAENIYKESLARTEGEARVIRVKTEEEARKLKTAMIDEAKAEAEQIVKTAFNAREKMREEIELGMRKRAPLLASQILKEVISPKAREVLHEELVKDVIAKIKKMEKTETKVKADRAEIVTAYPLQKAEKNELMQAVHGMFGREISFSEEEDERLAAGVIIKAGTLVIDGSLDNRMKQVCETLS